MNQSDRTMPSAVCGRAAPIGMDARVLSQAGERRACEYAKASRLGPNLLADGWLVDMNGCEASNLSGGSALVV